MKNNLFIKKNIKNIIQFDLVVIVNNIKINFILLIEVISFYKPVFIVQIFKLSFYLIFKYCFWFIFSKKYSKKKLVIFYKFSIIYSIKTSTKAKASYNILIIIVIEKISRFLSIQLNLAQV